MRKVPISLFVLWCVCLVGIVIGFGKSTDAYSIAGNNIWRIVGIVCSIVFGAGIVWYFVGGGAKKDK